MRTVYQNPLNLLNDHLESYPTPININYFWSFGSLAGICLMIQIVSGVLIAMHYTPHTTYAFTSVEHIMRDVNYGWLLRYLHANGASIFFIIVYLHFGRNLYFKSYEYQNIFVWTTGFIIFILMMAVGFMGYVLPWGQMSFWGATVITNLFSAIPIFGTDIAVWLWGGFGIDNPTLNRFFSLHYCLPFVILGIMLLHLHFLHYGGSSDPVGLYKNEDLVSFYPYFYVKDLLGFLFLALTFILLVFFYPNALGHPDNYIPANSLVTPAHLVPEWYFLPFYAILRSIPNKLGGFLCMFYLILSVYLLIVLDTSSTKQNKGGHIAFFYVFFILMYLGGQPMETPYIELSRIMTFFALFWFPSFMFISVYSKELSAKLPVYTSGNLVTINKAISIIFLFEITMLVIFVPLFIWIASVPIDPWLVKTPVSQWPDEQFNLVVQNMRRGFIEYIDVAFSSPENAQCFVDRLSFYDNRSVQPDIDAFIKDLRAFIQYTLESYPDCDSIKTMLEKHPEARYKIEKFIMDDYARRNSI